MKPSTSNIYRTFARVVLAVLLVTFASDRLVLAQSVTCTVEALLLPTMATATAAEKIITACVEANPTVGRFIETLDRLRHDVTHGYVDINRTQTTSSGETRDDITILRSILFRVRPDGDETRRIWLKTTDCSSYPECMRECDEAAGNCGGNEEERLLEPIFRDARGGQFVWLFSDQISVTVRSKEERIVSWNLTAMLSADLSRTLLPDFSVKDLDLSFAALPCNWLAPDRGQMPGVVDATAMANFFLHPRLAIGERESVVRPRLDDLGMHRCESDIIGEDATVLRCFPNLATSSFSLSLTFSRGRLVTFSPASTDDRCLL